MPNSEVNENLCTRCAHQEVCTYKQDYLDILKAVKNAVVTRDTPDGITSKKLFTMTSSVISLLVASTTLVRRPLERVRVYSRSYIKSSYMVVN